MLLSNSIIHRLYSGPKYRFATKTLQPDGPGLTLKRKPRHHTSKYCIIDVNFNCSHHSINFRSSKQSRFIRSIIFREIKKCDNRLSKRNIKMKLFFSFISLMRIYIFINSGREPIIYLWNVREIFQADLKSTWKNISVIFFSLTQYLTVCYRVIRAKLGWIEILVHFLGQRCSKG